MRYLITKEFKIDRNFLNQQLINLAEILETNETKYESFIIFNTSKNIARIGIVFKGDKNLIKRSYNKGRKRILIRFYYSFELFCGPFAEPSESPFNGVEDSKFLGWVEITGSTVVGILYNRKISDSLEQLKTICGISKQGIYTLDVDLRTF